MVSYNKVYVKHGATGIYGTIVERGEEELLLPPNKEFLESNSNSLYRDFKVSCLPSSILFKISLNLNAPVKF